MKKDWLILILTVFTSCLNNVDSELSKTEAKDVLPSFKFPVIIDTVDLSTLDFLKNDYSNSTWLTTAEYEFLYIGPSTDTIYVDHFLSYSPPPPPPPPNSKMKAKDYDIPEYKNKFDDYYIEWDSEIRFSHLLNVNLDIKVDTNFIFNNSQPIIITNTNKDTISVGYGNYIPLIMEALDSNKKWRPIQKRFIYMCGNGVGTIILPPNEIVLSSAPIFNGNFKTELRLTVPKTDIYSNTFDGSINYRQFESMFNEAGEYKSENKR